MSPLHAVRVDMVLVGLGIPLMTIYFPDYVIAKDYDFVLGSINLATSATPKQGEISTTLVGSRASAQSTTIPLVSNAIQLLLPPTLLQPFANIINNGTIYFRPTGSYLTNLDGSAVNMLLTPLPIDVVFDGLMFLIN